MSSVNKIENSLADAFKSAPKIPPNGKKVLVQWLPWINLIFGVLTLLSAYWLYNWARVANNLVNYVNDLTRYYGGTPLVNTSRWSVGIWLGLIVLVVEAVLYIAAFPGLKARKKRGWDMLFLAVLVNLVYGIVIVFTSYGGIGNLIGYAIGTVIGLWVLFQIRDMYSSGKSAPSSASNTPAA